MLNQTEEIKELFSDIRNRIDELERRYIGMIDQKNREIAELKIKTEKEESDIEIDIQPTASVLYENSPDWMRDRPGMPVDSFRSALSLNDKLLFINELFGGDSDLFNSFQDYVDGGASFIQIVEYCRRNFPHWDEGSESIYRLYMAVRQKIDYNEKR